METKLQNYLRSTKRVSSLLFIYVLIINVAYSQTIIPANNNSQAEDLVNTILVGTGVRIVPGSAVYSGQFINNTGGQIGTFINFGGTPAKTNLGIDKGIIMSNGDVSRANQPNTATSASSDYYNYYCTNCEIPKYGDQGCLNQANPACWNGDADLDAIEGCVPSCTFDAVSLQFDFIPTSNVVNFRYVFASDEYPNYVCSQNNDVFAFLVTGKNPKNLLAPYNKTNIAIVPGSNPPEYVSINTINSGKCGQGYNPCVTCDLNNSNYYVDNSLGKTIVYNAFTKLLTASLPVIPCDTYHIKLVLADVNDGAFDSSVFLQAQSFNVVPPVITYINPNSDSSATYKGCGQVKITFNTPYGLGVTEADSTISISFGGNAVYGVDYTTTNLPNPDLITMPQGSKSYTFDINPLCTQPGNDNEYIVFKVLTCDTSSSDTIRIKDIAPITATPGPNDTLCLGSSQTISVTNVKGGVGKPWHFAWSSNPAGNALPDDSVITVSPLVNTTYTVVIKDTCSICGPATYSIAVDIDKPVVNLIAVGSTTFCKGGYVVLNANPNNFAGYQWQTSGVNINGANANTDTIDSAGVYTLIVTDAKGCKATSNVITVTISNPVATLTAEGPTNICQGSSVILVANIILGYTYQWEIGGIAIAGATNTTLTVNSGGMYSFNMTDNVKCKANSNIIPVKVYPIPVVNIIPHGPFTTCTDTAVTLTANLDDDLFYQWQQNGENIIGATGNIFTFSAIGYYTLIESDSIGCSGTDSISVTIKCPVTTLFTPNAFTPDNTLYNREFFPKGLNVTAFSMDIFDRWGGDVFHTEDMSQSGGWNGKYNNYGKDCPQAVYVYKINYEGYFDNQYLKKIKYGTITLLR